MSKRNSHRMLISHNANQTKEFENVLFFEPPSSVKVTVKTYNGKIFVHLNNPVNKYHNTSISLREHEYLTLTKSAASEIDLSLTGARMFIKQTSMSFEEGDEENCSFKRVKLYNEDVVAKPKGKQKKSKKAAVAAPEEQESEEEVEYEEDSDEGYSPEEKKDLRRKKGIVARS